MHCPTPSDFCSGNRYKLSRTMGGVTAAIRENIRGHRAEVKID
jgi:hypothetical protein